MKRTGKYILLILAVVISLGVFVSCGEKKAANLQEYILDNEEHKAVATEKMKTFSEYYPKDRVEFTVEDNTLTYTATVNDAKTVQKGSCKAKYERYSDEFEKYADEIKEDSGLDSFQIIVRVVDRKDVKVFERVIER